MLLKKAKVTVMNCSNANTVRGRLNIPKKILDSMEITKEDNEVIIKYDENKKRIIISKK